MDARTEKRLKEAKGVSVHKGKLRIAFTLAGETTQTKRSLGIEPTAKNIDFAAMKLAEIRMDILRGTFSWEKHFPNDKETRKESPKLSEALDRFYLSSGHWKGSTERVSESKTRRLLELFGDAKLKDLTEDVILNVRKDLLKGTSAKHTNQLLTVLNTVMTRAVRAKVLDSNPFVYIEPIRDTKRLEGEAQTDDEVVSVFTPNEFENLLSVIPHEATKNLFTVLCWTGLRMGEAAGLKWEDVDLQKQTLSVKRTRTSKSCVLQTPKTGGARTIILPLRAVEALRRQKLLTTRSEFVFCSGPRLIAFKTAEVIKHVSWVKWLDQAGLAYRKPYSTRHTFASWMLMAGESETYVAQSMGHNSVQMIRQVYGHFIPKTTHKWTLDDPQKYEQLKNQT